ncbi:MAG: hypothetical protein HRT36_02710 [Alphaproteobacteria bacterium]|nr:hypothetical protein [Alphaproteobacteria bacterium]
MLIVSPARNPITESTKRTTLAPLEIPAPSKGLVTNAPITTHIPQTAVILENFWPTAQGIEPRGGSTLRCKTSAAQPITALFEYKAGAAIKYFVADSTKIYEFTDSTLSSDTISPVVTGQSGGNYRMVQTQTSGGIFLTVCNGKNPVKQFNGSAWSNPTITGVDSSKLSYVWAYSSRLFFIESGTMIAWYFGVNSVSGTVSSLNLSSVFNLGGALSFGATYSSDTGSGMDDQCVFVTTEGEVAIYAGINPSEASAWALRGVYSVGKPISADVIKVGGDIAIATQKGLVTLGAVITMDASKLQSLSLSSNISPDWELSVDKGGILEQWGLVKSKSALYAIPPQSSGGHIYAANIEINAWAVFTGWNVQRMAFLNEVLYFGDKLGKIFRGNYGGSDNGSSFEAKACLSFNNLGVARDKLLRRVRGKWKSSSEILPKHSFAKDYQPSFLSSPSVSPANSSASLWGSSLWDVDPWGASSIDRRLRMKWEIASGNADAFALQVQIVSGGTSKIDAEFIGAQLAFETGSNIGSAI